MLLIVLSMNFTAPSAPSQAELYLPEDTENFADGLLHILKTALSQISPDLTNAAQICLSLVAIVLLICLLLNGCSRHTTVGSSFPKRVFSCAAYCSAHVQAYCFCWQRAYARRMNPLAKA